MASYNKIHAFTEDLCKKVHNLGSDALSIALTTTANKPTTASTTFTPITYTNLTAGGSGTGGRTCTITSMTQTSGIAKLVLADLVFTASGTTNPFGVVVLFNDTATSDQMIAWWDYTGDVTLLNTETFTVDFDPSGGVFTLG